MSSVTCCSIQHIESLWVTLFHFISHSQLHVSTECLCRYFSHQRSINCSSNFSRTWLHCIVNFIGDSVKCTQNFIDDWTINQNSQCHFNNNHMASLRWCYAFKANTDCVDKIEGLRRWFNKINKWLKCLT